MSKSAKEIALEAKLAKAQAGSETAVYDAQVEVYEGQVTESRDAYTEAKAKRGKARAKLPEEIPDESSYKERLLEAQYSRGRARTQGELEQVDNFVTGITEQQEAKKTIKVLDEQMPALLSSAEKEVETTNKRITTAREKEIANQSSIITGFKNQIFAEQTRVYNEASATNTKAIETEKKRVAKQIDDFNKAEALRVSVLNKAEDARVLADNKLVADALSFVKADQKVKADLAFKAETKRLADLAVKEEKQRAKQEVIDKNKAFFDSGKRFYGGKEIHHAKLQGVPTQEGEIKYYDGGKFTLSYYERAGKQMGITTEQARKVSDAGRISQSGKARDQVLRSFQDPTGGLEAQYKENRRLAAKVTASARGAQAIKTAQASGTNTATDIYGSQSLVGTNVKAPQGNYTEQLQSAMRQQRTADLRAGNVGLATGLLDPVTAQKYTNTGTGESAISLSRKFLVERGYDLDNLDAVPNSVFKPAKYVEARKQAGSSGQMGDLTTLVPKAETMSPIGKVATVMVNGTKNEYFAPIPNAELVKRQEARARLDKFKALEENYNMLKTATAGTIAPTPKVRTITVPTISGGTFTANAPAVLQKKPFDTFGFDPIANQVNKNMNQSWTVTIPKDGGQYTADFKTKVEADLFVKEQTKQANVFSGTDNKTWNDLNYRSAVKTGELPHPSTTPSWNDDAKFYGNAILDSPKAVAYGVANLVLPEDKKIPVYESGSGRLIGGTVEDVISGDPLKGTGVKNAWEYVKADPIGTALEMPSEAVMWVAGGKVMQGITKGAVAVKSTLAVSKVIPQPLKTVGTKIESGVNTVKGVPKQAGVAVGSQVWKITPAQVQAGLKSVDKSLAYVGGQRVGLTTAMNLRYTLGGRKFLKESLATSSKENAMPKKTAQQFIDDPLASVNKKENPINIVSKNVIEVPIKKSDESIIHTRKIDFDSPAVKVGNVQQYYKSATPSFANVPRQGLQFPKAPKLPSLDSARNWITKTKQNVKRVEQGGYKAMMSGGNTKLKVIEKGMKAKDNILDAKQIARDEINYAKEDLSLLSKQKKMKYSDDKKQMISEVTESAKKTLVDPTSKAKRTDNAWNKLSQIKTGTRVKMGEMKKSITDRPATDELILYRETTETTATKSLAKSTTEPLTVSATPIKTSITQTKTPTDFTTKKVSKQFVEGEETLYPKGWKQAVPPKKPELVYENVEGSLFKLNKVDPNLQIIGEQVRIPFKDHKTIQSLDQANLDRMYQQGKYNVLEKGKLVEKKVEVKALQQEDVDKTFQQRNSQMTTVSTWGGVKSDTSFRYAINKKVLTTKLSPLPKKDMPKVIDRRMTQNDRTSQWTGSSDSGNPMTGKGRSNTSTIDEIGTYDPRTGTTTISKINAVSSPIKGKAKSVMKEYSSTLRSTKSPYKSAYVGGAIGEISFTSSILTPKDMIKTGVDTNSASITGVQGKIDSKVDTSMRQDSVQKLNADTASRLNTRSGIRSKLNIKLDTGLKTGQKTTTAQIPLLKIPIKSRQQTPKVLPIILPREKLKEKTRRGKKGKKAGFIGNVRLDNIMGMYKRKEITYGEKKVTKLERQDARLTSGTSNRISMPASGLLATKKKKKKKSTSVFGGGKDEFKGFGSKPKGKKKKSSLF